MNKDGKGISGRETVGVWCGQSMEDALAVSIAGAF